MKYIAKTIDNLEDVTIGEIKIVLGKDAEKISVGRVLFENSDVSKLAKNTRSCETIYELLDMLKFKTLEDIARRIRKIDFSFIEKDFVVRCSRDGIHNFTSNEAEMKVGEGIFGKGHKVNLESNEVIYVDINGNDCFIGRMIKDNLGKRAYRVKINNQSITPMIAYCLLKIAKYDAKESLLDPFCKDGVILIEAALSGGKRIHGIDNWNNIRNANINSAMAKAKINFYVDGKDFNEEKIDKIITKLPSASKRTSDNEIKRILDNFFKKICMKAIKSIAIITTNDKYLIEIAEKNSMKINSSRDFSVGDQKYKIRVFSP